MGSLLIAIVLSQTIVHCYINYGDSLDLPLIFYVPSQPGLWLATGFNVGIGTGGGSAEFLANWMTTGQPPVGLDAVHADRFGQSLKKEAVLASIREVYSQGYQLPDVI